MQRFESMVEAALRRSLGSPMPKQIDDSCLQENESRKSVKLMF